MKYEQEFKVTPEQIQRELKRIRIEMREYDEDGKAIRRPVDNSLTDTRKGV